MTSTRRRPGILAAVCALGGCGSDGSSPRPDTQTDEAAVKKVLTTALDALYDGDGARACALYTSSYQRELLQENREENGRLAAAATCEEQVKDFQPVLKRYVPNRAVTVIRITVRGDDATAVSEYDTTRGKTRIKEFLVRRGGAWKIDHDQEPGEPAPG